MPACLPLGCGVFTADRVGGRMPRWLNWHPQAWVLVPTAPAVWLKSLSLARLPQWLEFPFAGMFRRDLFIHICNMDLWSLGLWSGFDVDYHSRMFNLLPADNSWPRTARMWPNAKLQFYLNLVWNIMGCFVYFFISFGNSIAQVSILNFCGWQGTRKPKGCFLSLSPGWSWKVNSILFPDLRFSFLIEPTLGRIKRGWAQKRLGMRICYPIWTSVC